MSLTGSVLFDYWLDDVLPSITGGEVDLIMKHIRDAAIDFCERSYVWRVDGLPITVIADQRQYTLLSPVEEAEIVRVEQVFISGKEITVASISGLSQQNINFMTGKGNSRCYVQEYTDKLGLYPMPSTQILGGLTYKVSLRPSRVAEGMNDSVGKRYFEAIAHGAKARLFEIPSKPWSDAQLSTYHRAKFEMMARQAKDEVSSGLGRGSKRVVSHY